MAPAKLVIETLDELDGDFELQKPSAGGSLGVLVPPWLFEGSPTSIAEAQSPFTNLTGRTGDAGVRFPADAADHRIWQRLWPARSAKAGRELHVNLDFRTASAQPTGRGPTDSALGHGTDGSPAVAVEIGAKIVLASDGGCARPIRPHPPGDVVQPAAHPRPRAEDLFRHHRCAGGRDDLLRTGDSRPAGMARSTRS